MSSSKSTKICTKCGKKSDASSKYCADCGAKLVAPKEKTENNLKKYLEEEKKNDQITLKNMYSRISGVTFIAAKVIVKTSIVSFRLKPPTRYDGYSTKAFIILHGTLGFTITANITDEVKKKILEDLGTDLDISQVEWLTPLSISYGLKDMGWNAVSCGADYYIWPANGSTIKSLITIDYADKKPHKKIVKGKATYSRDDIQHDQSFEVLGVIIGLILIALLVFLATK